MYEELVKRLRAVAGGGREEKCDGCPYEEDYPCCVDCLDTLHKQAADAIEELNLVAESNRRNAKAWADTAEKAAEQIPRWIPVTERLPNDGVYVLAYSADDDYMCVEARHKFAAFQITHWMPLPEPPKEETE